MRSPTSGRLDRYGGVTAPRTCRAIVDAGMVTRWHLVITVAAAACGRSSAKTVEPAHVEPARVEAAVTRVSFELPGDANGAYWDAHDQALYVTDDDHHQVVRWTDAHGFEPAGAFPAGAKVGLGALVRVDDGTFITTSFGFGSDGGVAIAGAAGSLVPGLDPTRRRIGLARAPDGTLYDAYFVVHPGSKHDGGVALLDLKGSETELAIPGLAKPVGLAATATTLYISDQEQRVVLAYDLAHATVTTFARDLPSVDLLTLLPDGELVTGGKSGGVYRIDLHGAVTTIASGFEQVRGTAYDPARKRLFVIEHSKATSRHHLYIIPLAL